MRVWESWEVWEIKRRRVKGEGPKQNPEGIETGEVSRKAENLERKGFDPLGPLRQRRHPRGGVEQVTGRNKRPLAGLPAHNTEKDYRMPTRSSVRVDSVLCLRRAGVSNKLTLRTKLRGPSPSIQKINR